MTISARIYKPAKSALCIVTSVSTGSTSSGEVPFKRLWGDTHDTAKGVLMFRCWQIAAENFVSPEQVAVYSNEIVASALNLSDLMSHITKFDKPLVTFIPSEPVVWNFTYAV